MTTLDELKSETMQETMKDMAITQLYDGMPESEVFDNLEDHNKRHHSIIDNERIKELLSNAKNEVKKRLDRPKQDGKPWEINRNTVFRQLAKDFSDARPFFYDRNRIWWMWNEREYRWHMVDEVDLMVALDSWTRVESEKPAFKHSLMEGLKKQGRISLPTEPPKTWIQFEDTLVDIGNNRHYEASPKYLITNPIPWRLGLTDKTPTIDRLFKDWVVGGSQDASYIITLHEIAAFCLLTDYPLHRIICLIGSGCNGKGSFIRLLEKFVGQGNYTSSDIHALSSRPFESAKLYRKLLCTMGEIDKAVFRKTSLLKRLTGQDTIGFEIKRKNPFDGLNYAKIVIATNTLPETTDKSDGFFRRWLIVDFPNKFEEKGDVLKEIPDLEFENLATKSIRVLPALLARGRFTNEGDIDERRQRYEKRSNMLDDFIHEYFDNDANHSLVYTEVYERYLDYLKAQGLRHQSKVEFSKALGERGYEVRKKRYPEGIMRAIYGLRWKEEIEEWN